MAEFVAQPELAKASNSVNALSLFMHNVQGYGRGASSLAEFLLDRNVRGLI